MDDGRIFVSGLLCVADQPNRSQTVYPRHVLENALSGFGHGIYLSPAGYLIGKTTGFWMEDDGSVYMNGVIYGHRECDSKQISDFIDLGKLELRVNGKGKCHREGGLTIVDEFELESVSFCERELSDKREE